MAVSAIHNVAGAQVSTLAQMRALGRTLDASDAQVVRETAAGMVSEMFLKPMLAEMRSFPFGGQFAHGGRGEATFAERLDEQLADVVAQTGFGGLIDQIVEHLRPAGVQAEPAARGAADAWGPLAGGWRSFQLRQAEQRGAAREEADGGK